MIINDKFLEVACACATCTKTFARIRKLIAAIDDRPEALKDLENNLEGEVNPDETGKLLLTNSRSLGETTAASTEATSQNANPENQQAHDVDPAKTISDYLLSKFFENIDQAKIANLTKNMSVDAQYYVSKNLNDLRDKFAQFVKKFIDPNKSS